MQTFGDVTVTEVHAGSSRPVDEAEGAGLYVIVVVAGEVQAATADDVVLVPASERPRVTLRAGARVLVCSIRGSLLERLRPYVPPAVHVLNAGELGQWSVRLFAELQRPDCATPLFVEAAVCDVLARSTRASAARPLTAPVLAAMQYASDHLHERMTVAELAGAARLSARALTARFSAELHVAPLEHVRALRIRRAAQALRETTCDLAEIAQSLGFYDHAHLTRSFREALGMTPTEYRRAV